MPQASPEGLYLPLHLLVDCFLVGAIAVVAAALIGAVHFPRTPCFVVILVNEFG